MIIFDGVMERNGICVNGK